MLDGKTLETYFRLAHHLREYGISITEYDSMVPWRLGVFVDLIHEENEAKKNSKRNRLDTM